MRGEFLRVSVTVCFHDNVLPQFSVLTHLYSGVFWTFQKWICRAWSQCFVKKLSHRPRQMIHQKFSVMLQYCYNFAIDPERQLNPKNIFLLYSDIRPEIHSLCFEKYLAAVKEYTNHKAGWLTNITINVLVINPSQPQTFVSRPFSKVLGNIKSMNLHWSINVEITRSQLRAIGLIQYLIYHKFSTLDFCMHWSFNPVLPQHQIWGISLV